MKRRTLALVAPLLFPVCAAAQVTSEVYVIDPSWSFCGCASGGQGWGAEVEGSFRVSRDGAILWFTDVSITEPPAFAGFFPDYPADLNGSSFSGTALTCPQGPGTEYSGELHITEISFQGTHRDDCDDPEVCTFLVNAAMPKAPGIPTMGGWGLAAFVAMLVLAGLWLLSSRYALE
jgi:hypothetical protein